ncbi:MAG TPA: sugar phosphate nucleotidyltransferase [Candidatus Nanoarchaeia archaeon]|nr:sugar phosphate nucleotidyltransferase [Candidatus Nanoarchaeia archaeon]
MNKTKIAISLDPPLLEIIDSRIDGSIIRSRSQAIEYYLRQGLKEQAVDKAVILLKGDHHINALKIINNRSLIKNQLEFMQRNGIKSATVVTQFSKNINLLLQEISESAIPVNLLERNARGNAEALFAIKSDISSENFVVLSGDIYYDFDLKGMIRKHLQSGKIATMGLMSRPEPSEYGNAVLEGDLIVDFKEKPKKSESNVVNAGIYVFNKQVFELMDKIIFLEKELFPRIARSKQLAGYFLRGEYRHVV